MGPAGQSPRRSDTIADEFAAEVAKLCATVVTRPQWEQFLDRHVPLVDTRSSDTVASAGARPPLCASATSISCATASRFERLSPR
jgi:hypothetical protein